jgi:hypothetical protein
LSDVGPVRKRVTALIADLVSVLIRLTDADTGAVTGPGIPYAVRLL